MTNATQGKAHVVGIDVSKRSLDVCLLPEGETFVVSNDHEGVDELLSRLEGTRPELVVLEATGRYERLATTSIAASGIAVAVVNPRQARDVRGMAIGRLAKTDRIDAEVLARFASAVGPPPSVIPDEEAVLLQAILARRRQLLAMLTAEKNRLQMAPEALRKRIRAHMRWLEKEIERTDRDLDEAIEASATFKENEALLRSVPGVGPVLARTLLADLPELETLTHKRRRSRVSSFHRTSSLALLRPPVVPLILGRAAPGFRPYVHLAILPSSSPTYRSPELLDPLQLQPEPSSAMSPTKSSPVTKKALTLQDAPRSR